MHDRDIDKPHAAGIRGNLKESVRKKGKKLGQSIAHKFKRGDLFGRNKNCKHVLHQWPVDAAG